jgi:hypothetical protein
MTRVLSRLLALYALRCAWRAWRRRLTAADVRFPPVTFRAWDGYVVDGVLNEDGTPHVFPLDGSLTDNGNDVMITWTNAEPRIFQI